MRFPFAMACCTVLALGGCTSTPKPPPEPDMSRMSPVNKTLPSELVGKAVLPLKTPVQQWKAGDAK